MNRETERGSAQCVCEHRNLCGVRAKVGMNTACTEFAEPWDYSTGFGEVSQMIRKRSVGVPRHSSCQHECPEKTPRRAEQRTQYGIQQHEWATAQHVPS